MLFQAIDDKTSCVGIYAHGELNFGELPPDLTKTWKYAGYLEGKEIEYAYLYCNGRNLEEVCPDDLKEDWKKLKRKFEAYLKSFNIARISMNDNCIYDLIPHGFIKEFFDARNRITKHVFETHEKPKNYDFLKETHKVIYDIRYQELKINFSNVRNLLTSTRTREYARNLKRYEKNCRYNMFGTVTGRFTTEPGSFPILTMPKELRGLMEPHNDWFLALDYNGAEVRTMMSLTGLEQPEYDVHDWNVKNIFKEDVSRDEAKKKFFSWLYNPKSNEIESDVYDRNELVDKYWDNGQLTTIYDRTMAVDRDKALNYCLQSTCADTISERTVAIHDYLKNKKSNISFLIHDEIIIDLADSEREMIPELIEIFSNNKLGKFLTNVRVGKNGNDLQELNL